MNGIYFALYSCAQEGGKEVTSILPGSSLSEAFQAGGTVDWIYLTPSA
jgi:hypothetical protein